MIADFIAGFRASAYFAGIFFGITLVSAALAAALLLLGHINAWLSRP